MARGRYWVAASHSSVVVYKREEEEGTPRLEGEGKAWLILDVTWLILFEPQCLVTKIFLKQ